MSNAKPEGAVEGAVEVAVEGAVEVIRPPASGGKDDGGKPAPAIITLEGMAAGAAYADRMHAGRMHAEGERTIEDLAADLARARRFGERFPVEVWGAQVFDDMVRGQRSLDQKKAGGATTAKAKRKRRDAILSLHKGITNRTERARRIRATLEAGALAGDKVPSVPSLCRFLKRNGQ